MDEAKMNLSFEELVEHLDDETLERLSKAVSQERLSRLLDRLQAGALERFDRFEAEVVPRFQRIVSRVKTLR